jgi:hypothetical protein
MITTRENQSFGCKVYEPTREDIQRAREEIQATWSPRERAKRNTGPRTPWWTAKGTNLRRARSRLPSGRESWARQP